MANETNGTYNMSAEMTQFLQSINQTQMIITPTLFFVGLIGNMLILVTVSRGQFGQVSTKTLLKALAVTDSILLATNVFNQHFARSLFGLDVRALSTISCKIFFVIYRVSKMSSSWFIVLVALERFVAILFPLHVRRTFTRMNIYLAIFGVFIYNIAICCVWTVSTEIEDNICKPDVTNDDNAAVHKTFVLVGGLTYSIVPIAILLVITPPIVYKLLQHRRTRHALSATSIHGNVYMQNMSRVTVMLIGIVLWYIICVIPITLVLVLTFWTNKSIFDSRDQAFILFTMVAQTFEQINHSSNFYIYLILSRQFRRSFLHTIICKKDLPHSNVSSSQAKSTSTALYMTQQNGVSPDSSRRYVTSDSLQDFY